jgi:hypothetical protein
VLSGSAAMATPASGALSATSIQSRRFRRAFSRSSSR